jgi:hypothetical protein
LLALEWKIKEYHLYRETNFYVDVLANIWCEYCPDLHVYELCPSKPSSLLFYFFYKKDRNISQDTSLHHR